MRRFSFLDTIVVVNGVELTGWADGDDVISIARRTDPISDQIGADGRMMVSVSADRSGELTFRLQQTSSGNKYLNSLLQLQEFAGSRFIPVTVMFRDTYRQDMATGTLGYIKRPADMQRGTAANNQEWTIVTERLDLVYGDVTDDILPIIGAAVS